MKNTKLPPHYDSIDAPVYVWNKVHETGDLNYLLINRKPTNEKQKQILSDAWNKIYDEYIKEFGFSNEFKAIIEKRKEIAILKLQLIIENDATLQTMIEINEEILSQIQIGKQSNFFETKMMIEKAMNGMYIDVHKVSIREFYTYLQVLSKK